MINKKYRFGFMAVIIICIVLLAIGAKYDYAITDKLYNPQNTVAIFFEAFSKLPIMAFIPVLGGCMLTRNRNKASNIVIGIVVLIRSCSVFCYFTATALVERNLWRRANPYLCGIAGGLISAAIFLILRGLKKSSVRKIQSLCAFSAVYAILYLGSTAVLKIICGRDRYMDIITGGEFEFAPWFKPVFFSHGTSFPSGHTAAAMGILVILLIPFIFKGFEKLSWIFFTLAYIFVFATGITRFILGMHFLSDVAASVLIMTIWFMIISPVYEKLYSRELVTTQKRR